MRRRDLLALVAGGAAIAWPFAARAQKAMPVLGFLSGGSSDPYAPYAVAFREGLNETGYIEGQNLTVEYRWADGHYDRLPALADDLVARKVNAIATGGGPRAALAAKGATSTIPIAFLSGDDPVALGIVDSLAHPGGNLTGVSFLVVDLHPKRLEVLSELVPQIRVIALLVNPDNVVADRIVREVQEAARAKGIQNLVLRARTEGEISTAFGSLAQLNAGALLVGADPFFTSQRGQLVALAAQRALPAIYFARDFATAGGLISYGSSLTAAYRLLGTYAGKMLKGEKPADLPVEQPTKFELVINLKTAKALGLTVPQSLLARADEVIE